MINLGTKTRELLRRDNVGPLPVEENPEWREQSVWVVGGAVAGYGLACVITASVVSYLFLATVFAGGTWVLATVTLLDAALAAKTRRPRPADVYSDCSILGAFIVATRVPVADRPRGFWFWSEPIAVDGEREPLPIPDEEPLAAPAAPIAVEEDEPVVESTDADEGVA